MYQITIYIFKYYVSFKLAEEQLEAKKESRPTAPEETRHRYGVLGTSNRAPVSMG